MFPTVPSSTTTYKESGDMIQFIVSSERTGFRHLYLVAYQPTSGSTITPITSGSYQVADKPITVDAERHLVYFIAKRDTVLETQLYVASYANGAQPGNVRRLTQLGFSHQVTLDVEKDRFLTMYSSVDQSPACAVMHFRWSECRRPESWTSPSMEHQRAPRWCSCGCQFPKISSHAFMIREGIYNQSARHIRRCPVVPPSNSGHTRTCSESAVNPTRADSGFGAFKTGSMNSISGFLASHLLSSSLLSGPKANSQSSDSSMILSSSGGSGRKPSLKFAPPPNAHSPTQSSGSASSFSSSPSSSASMPTTNAANHPVGEFFTFTSSDNVTLHGCLYRPSNYVEGQKYPTLVSIYGGPRSQMVTNEYKLPKFLRVFLATRTGHAVVMIDGRGSNDRGLEFEGRLRNRMGQVEIQDQVDGLRYLAKPENGGLVDMERVAITGWSYGKSLVTCRTQKEPVQDLRLVFAFPHRLGGYLSLMALAQYPHIFKIAIAGAPVTQWELYNSAYTERYMGLIHENTEAYTKSNVLNWVEKLPDQ